MLHNLHSYRFLVTGGAGFIGSHIVAFLLQHGAKHVVVLDNLSTGSLTNVQLFQHYSNYTFIKGDIRDYQQCLNACENIDYISHQAALGSVPRSVADPISTNAVNVTGFVNLLHAAQQKGVKRLVYASSSSVYGDSPILPKEELHIGNPLSPYAASKMSNELYAQAFAKVYNIQTIGLRYFNVFGPRQSPKGPYAAVIPLFIHGLIHKTPVYINGNGLQTRDFTYVSNAVQANVLAMLNNKASAINTVYNVAVGKQYSIKQVFEYIANYLQSTQKPIYRKARIGDVQHSLANISKIQRELQYTPQVDFISGLEYSIKAHLKDLF